MEKIKEELIRAYALKNAIEHEGKAVSGSVLSPLFHAGLEKSKVKEIMPIITKVISEVNKLDIYKQKEEYQLLSELVTRRSVRVGLQELENYEADKVVTRFAPSPSGPLHLGHSATGMPSSIYVKKYGGKFFIRIEDTNPDNIYTPAYEMIPEEANWLFGNVAEVIVQSDRMERYYFYAREMITKGACYVCTCNSEDFKKLIEESKPCTCRKLSPEENIKRWDKMLDKSGYNEGDAVLRFKSNLKDPNPALRDFPLARINLTEHPRQKKKYKVWPLMNLAVSVDDMEFGTTHAIRAKEHQDNAVRQEMIFKIFNRKSPETLFLGRYKFNDLELSCSRTKELIKEKVYSGWDDIRLPFMNVLKRRGYQSKAFEKMAEERGISDVDKVMDKKDFFKLLDTFNREVIKDTATKVEIDEKGKKINLLMPNKELKELKLNKKKFEDGEIIFIENIGYARYNADKKELWFAHD